MKSTLNADAFYANAEQWRDELTRLRKIVLAAGLTETMKWGAPCYTCNGHNVVGVGGFKAYFGLWFHQGVLLSDPHGVLINAQEGKTRALRQWRMTRASDIRPRRIGQYLAEAKALAEAGKSVAPRRRSTLMVPGELKAALAANPAAADAFKALRPGQQREYADHVGEAKRADTRLRRVDKVLPMILAGRGLNDRYRKQQGS